MQGVREATELRRTAYAVEVIDLTENQREAGDLGDALTRSNAVTVRRSGGLGSAARFSMGGMGGERVRFFIDGVPLKFAGFPYGPAYIPVNLVDRIEMYQGVVPIRFGTDALGGVVAFVTDQSTRTNQAQLSYEVGSFNTHRLGASGKIAFPDSKSFVRVSGHLDSSDNDYPVDVLVADPQGRLMPKTLRRFHDDYRSYGVTLSGGIIERKWADRLVATAFASGVSKEIQNDPSDEGALWGSYVWQAFARRKSALGFDIECRALNLQVLQAILSWKRVLRISQAVVTAGQATV